jgi:spore maturation protein CgeB
MRIGIIGPVEADSFSDNIHRSLLRMGHQSFQLGSAHFEVGRRGIDAALTIAQRMNPSLDAAIQRRIARKAAGLECEIVINLDARLEVQIVEDLRRAGRKVCFWFPDAMVNLGRFSSVLAPYDALFFTDPLLVSRLRAVLGLPAHYLAEACNPEWHFPPPGLSIEPTLVVVGNYYPSRIVLLRRLDAAGIPLRLYGAPLPRWVRDDRLRALHSGEFVVRERKAAVFRSAAAVLNNLHPGEVFGVNARLFEAAGCGAAIITEWREALPDLFVEDEEVLAFRSFDELVAKARALLADPARSRALGDAAARRAHADHSYENRLDHILRTIA